MVILNPLYCGGLCEPVIITEFGQTIESMVLKVAKYATGVGISPSAKTFISSLKKPSASQLKSVGECVRAS